jgi:hypothetical protein
VVGYVLHFALLIVRSIFALFVLVCQSECICDADLHIPLCIDNKHIMNFHLFPEKSLVPRYHYVNIQKLPIEYQ